MLWPSLLMMWVSALNGEPIPDEAYGEHPVGIITYSKSGWMSATSERVLIFTIRVY